MECRASLVYAHLASPRLDPDDVRYGQLLTLLAGASVLLAFHLLMLLVQASL